MSTRSRLVAADELFAVSKDGFRCEVAEIFV